jgi:hypothetical protein
MQEVQCLFLILHQRRLFAQSILRETGQRELPLSGRTFHQQDPG